VFTGRKAPVPETKKKILQQRREKGDSKEIGSPAKTGGEFCPHEQGREEIRKKEKN